MNHKYLTQLIEKLFPAAMCAVCFFIWHDISEMKADIKSLLAQSNIDKTKIENLERFTFGSKARQSALYPYERLMFKHEEEIDIKKYLNHIS